MRRIADPHHDDWYVDVDWTGRTVGRRIERRLAAARARRPPRPPRPPDRRTSRRKALDGVRDLFDGLDFLSALAELGLWPLLVAAAIVAIAFLTPWALVLLLELLELLLFPMLAAAIVGWRVARKHAFTVVAARRGAPMARWTFTGWRAARRIERAIAEAIRVGGDVEALFPELRQNAESGRGTATE